MEQLTGGGGNRSRWHYREFRVMLVKVHVFLFVVIAADGNGEDVREVSR